MSDTQVHTNCIRTISDILIPSAWQLSIGIGMIGPARRSVEHNLRACNTALVIHSSRPKTQRFGSFHISRKCTKVESNVEHLLYLEVLAFISCQLRSIAPTQYLITLSSVSLFLRFFFPARSQTIFLWIHKDLGSRVSPSVRSFKPTR